MSVAEAVAVPPDHSMGKGSSSSAPIGYEPTPQQEEAIRLVERCYQKARNARKPYDEKWLDYYRMFRGKQWKDTRPSYRHSEVINLISRAIQSSVPILTDGRPKPQFIPQEPQDLEVAGILNEVLESDWDAGNWLHTLTEIIYDAHFYGAGFGCLKYDPDADEGAGRVGFESDDPFAMYPDPAARDVNQKCNYFVHAEPRPIDELKRKYPEFAEFIKPDLIDYAKRDRSYFDAQVRYRSPTDNRSIVEGQSYDIEANDEALVITMYIHDLAFVEEEMEAHDEKTGEQSKVYVQRLKYPKGRKLTVINGVLVHESDIEYDDKKFPYIRLLNYVLPREFWGISEVEQLESPQKMFNKLLSFALDVLTLMGNPIWVVDTTSGVDVDNLFNRPGLIIEKEPGSEVRREEGVHLQPYVLQMLGELKQYFDDISGSNDVSRGVKPEGVTAASAIEALQEAAQTRLRQKTRNIDTFMQNFGQMYLSRVFQYYDAPRVFRITNDQSVTKYFKFHIEKYDDPESGDQKLMAKVRDFNQGDDGKQYLGEERAYEIRGKFDVRVSSGSSLPFEKQRVESQTYQLFDRGIIDAEEVLKNIKYPNAEAVLQRVAEKQAMAQEQAMMQQAAPAQPLQ